jgi:hypothetical protein
VVDASKTVIFQVCGAIANSHKLFITIAQLVISKSNFHLIAVPLARRSEPQVQPDSPKVRLMMDILDRDYVEITFSKAPQNGLPSLLGQPVRKTNNITAAEFEAASEVIISEMSLVETDYPQYGDFDIVERWFAKKKHVFPQYKAKAIVQVAQALTYRFKIQEHFLMAAEYLIRTHLLSIDALYTPMSLFRYSPSHQAVLEALQCFPLVQKCTDHESKGLGQEFEAPVRWLATVIVRSCADWRGILDRLCTVHMLGAPDMDRIQELSKRFLKVRVNPKELEDKEVESPQVGFWLPHGVKIRDLHETWKTRYLLVKDVYENLTGSELSDCSIVESAMTRLLEIEKESTS